MSVKIFPKKAVSFSIPTFTDIPRRANKVKTAVAKSCRRDHKCNANETRHPTILVLHFSSLKVHLTQTREKIFQLETLTAERFGSRQRNTDINSWQRSSALMRENIFHKIAVRFKFHYKPSSSWDNNSPTKSSLINTKHSFMLNKGTTDLLK